MTRMLCSMMTRVSLTTKLLHEFDQARDALLVDAAGHLVEQEKLGPRRHLARAISRRLR